MTEENQTPNEAETTAPAVETPETEPSIGAEIPADAQPATPTTDGPPTPGEAPAEAANVAAAPAPVVSEPVNQPEVAATPAAEQAEPATPEPAKQPEERKRKNIYRYTFGVYHKGNPRSSVFEIEFLSTAERASAQAAMIISENVADIKDYKTVIKKVMYVSVT